MILRKLSQVLGAIKKGYIVDTFAGSFPVYGEVWVPATLSAAGVLASTALTASVQTITAWITDPDVFRTVSIVGNQASVTWNVVINGKDRAWYNISETLASNWTTTVVWNRAFASVDSIVLPVLDTAWDEISVWVTDKLWLYREIEATWDVISVYVDWVREAASAVDATYSTFTPTTATDSSNRYIVSFLTKFF